MNNTAVVAVLLILAVVILVGNTLIAVAFLRGRRNNLKSFPGADSEAIDELHKRVQGLTRKPK